MGWRTGFWEDEFLVYFIRNTQTQKRLPDSYLYERYEKYRDPQEMLPEVPMYVLRYALLKHYGI
jgi:hypothetical protein